MAISERERHQLHQSLDKVMGPDVAAILMSHLPPVGWADVATKHDLAELEGRMSNQLRAALGDLRTEMYAGFSSLQSQLHREIGDLRDEMHREIGGLRDEMHREIGGLRDEMHGEIGSLRGEIGSLRGEIGSIRSDLHAMTRTYILGNIALVLTVAAIMLGIERLL